MMKPVDICILSHFRAAGTKVEPLFKSSFYFPQLKSGCGHSKYMASGVD